MSIVFEEVVGVVGPGSAQDARGGEDEDAAESGDEPNPDRLRAELHTITRREARVFAD